ncbi:unnamed protein product [Phytophthora lilii]|uniref:Unnamed protein product n=1 Tax=Phytophthora lilii TaxID=2077276 RepID=A0A9W6UC00_9STRA|nr:unnamed protein product [Phytophthora lilii]
MPEETLISGSFLNDLLSQTTIPPKSAFDSKLCGTSITSDDYKRVKFVCGSIIMAITAQRELFMRFDLDMFSDGVSLPGLSEKVMYQTCFNFNSLQYPDKKYANAFQFPAKRLGGYKSQDAKAQREFGMTLDHLNTLLQKQKYWSVVLSATPAVRTCRSRNKKLIELNSDRLVYSIKKEKNDIYAKMKANIAGGPSIIFNRYAKRNETRIRSGKLCKKFIGYDANALYLWALGNDMPCGRLATIEAYDGIVEDIVADKILGFLECDIQTPDHLKDYFSEMTPIFKKKKHANRLC